MIILGTMPEQLLNETYFLLAVALAFQREKQFLLMKFLCPFLLSSHLYRILPFLILSLSIESWKGKKKNQIQQTFKLQICCSKVRKFEMAEKKSPCNYLRGNLYLISVLRILVAILTTETFLMLLICSFFFSSERNYSSILSCCFKMIMAEMYSLGPQ